jgi:hypothetical protein
MGMIDNQFPMLQALHAEAPAPDRASQMMLYGQFVGSWEGRFVYHAPDSVPREAPCEVHFGWALEGRAVQDVWIVPSRSTRQAPDTSAPGILYGTTLRVYDPRSDLWQITWIDPVRQDYDRMTGRKIGDDIVQEYRIDDRTRCQWLFTEITASSFHWLRRESRDDGKTWNIRVEFFLQRGERSRPP